MLCYVSHLLIQSVYTQLPSIIVLYVMVPVVLVGTVSYTRTSTVLYFIYTQSFPKRVGDPTVTLITIWPHHDLDLILTSASTQS